MKKSKKKRADQIDRLSLNLRSGKSLDSHSRELSESIWSLYTLRSVDRMTTTAFVLRDDREIIGRSILSFDRLDHQIRTVSTAMASEVPEQPSLHFVTRKTMAERNRIPISQATIRTSVIFIPSPSSLGRSPGTPLHRLARLDRLCIGIPLRVTEIPMR